MKKLLSNAGCGGHRRHTFAISIPVGKRGELRTLPRRWADGADNAAAAPAINPAPVRKAGQTPQRERVSCARAIVAATKQRGLAERGAVIASPHDRRVEPHHQPSHRPRTASVCSSSGKLGYPRAAARPTWSTNAFLNKMLRLYRTIRGRRPHRPWWCQKVQVSGFGGRGYQPQAADAQVIVKRVVANGPSSLL